MKKSIITIGNSASGKSEFINNYCDDTHYFILDTDDFNPSETQERKREICAYWIKHFVEKEGELIIMATGGSQEIIKTIDYLKENKYYITIFYFNTSFGTCVARNDYRERKVPFEIMAKIADNIENNLPILKEKADRFYEIKGE